MNVINGKVLANESGFGIPGLLVVVFDVDPRTIPKELVSTGSEGRRSAALAALGQGGHGDRLGSVLTDGTGPSRLRTRTTHSGFGGHRKGDRPFSSPFWPPRTSGAPATPTCSSFRRPFARTQGVPSNT
jgi:hypothetical protein